MVPFYNVTISSGIPQPCASSDERANYNLQASLNPQPSAMPSHAVQPGPSSNAQPVATSVIPSVAPANVGGSYRKDYQKQAREASYAAFDALLEHLKAQHPSAADEYVNLGREPKVFRLATATRHLIEHLQQQLRRSHTSTAPSSTNPTGLTPSGLVSKARTNKGRTKNYDAVERLRECLHTDFPMAKVGLPDQRAWEPALKMVMWLEDSLEEEKAEM